MSQATAGETITIHVDGAQLSIKIEDASKSEAVLAKVQASESDAYKVGQVYEFDRALLA